MIEELNELEKIGLAFISGMVAGQSLQQANEEVEAESKEGKKEMKVATGVLVGDAAEEFKSFIKKMGVE